MMSQYGDELLTADVSVWGRVILIRCQRNAPSDSCEKSLSIVWLGENLGEILVCQ